jgi:hypothetical protein
MAFIRNRGTSTTLVEAYRDEQGRPRQRVLANLHGEPDALSALAKLAARRAVLRKEQDALAKEAVHANEFYEFVTANTLHGHRYSEKERREIDRLMTKRDRLLKRLTKVEALLAMVERDGAVIRKHCSASPEEVQAAIKVYRERESKAEALILGLEFADVQRREARAALRRLRIRGEWDARRQEREWRATIEAFRE